MPRWLNCCLAIAILSPLASCLGRDGRAPPGVSLQRALQTAERLQPELFAALPAEFQPQFKAPCWYINATGEAETALDAAYGGSQLRCLPYFYLLGDFNCGVRDVASRLAHHPKVASLPSPHWWDESKKWGEYWPQFKSAAARIEREPDVIMGDSSAASFAFMWAGCQRTNTPFSEAMAACHGECGHDSACLAERCYAAAAAAWHPIDGDGSKLSTPWLMRLATGGGVKHVVMLRDPTERLHAAFWAGHHYGARYGFSEEGFAAFANETLADFAACAAAHERDACVLAFEAQGKKQEEVYYHADQLVKGAYSVYLRQWQAAFGADNVLVLRLEDWARMAESPTEHEEASPSGRLGVARGLRRILQHLGLPQPPAEAWAAMLAPAPARGSHPREATPQRSPPERIDAAVRARVDAFYAPFDAELDELTSPGFSDWKRPLSG